MSNPIPPLVCNTPPPIDDDFEPFDDDFGSFEGTEEPVSPRDEKLSAIEVDIPFPEVPVVLESPTITHLPPREDPIGASDEPTEWTREESQKCSHTKSDFFEKTPQVPDDTGQESLEDRLEDTLNIKRCESPPSLVLSEDFSCFPEDAQVEGNSGDEVSLSSLHLDSANASKSVTPTFTAQTLIVNNTESFVIAEDDKVESEQEEDFDDFTSFTTAPVEGSEITLEKAEDNEETSARDIIEPEEKVDNPPLDFVADFSQFPSSMDNPETQEVSMVVTSSENQVMVVEKQPDLDDDDDEFGDFSDFQQPEPTPEAVIDTTNFNSQFQSALNIMYPKIEEDKSEEENKIEVDSIQKNQILEDLRDFEKSRALQYQWQNSSSNQSLIRSLGIDSRNILYGGGKWNCSMPRFAANLGFSPLQPKPVAGSSTGSSQQYYPTSGEVDESHPLPPGLSDVPAAQFDWTSSGLVNPLDASQAHTLLLDLEQLVVVANLDKIKHDSSSSCSVVTASSSAAFCNVGPSSVDHLIMTIASHNNGVQRNTEQHQSSCIDGSIDWSLFDNFITNSTTAISSNGDGFTNKYSSNKHLINSFDTFLDISSPKVLPKSNNSKDSKEQPEPIATSAPSVATAAASASSQLTSDDIVMEKEVSVHDVPPPVVTPSFSHQPLRETHIFTPNKSINPISREISDHLPVPLSEGKIIVKEYHDVEYNPDRVKIDDDFSEFTEFQGSATKEVTLTPNLPQASVEKPPDKIIESPYHRPEKISEFTRPTFGVSPTEEMVNGVKSDQKAEEEDDFCDFQSVTPHSTSKQPTSILQPLNVMNLSESGPKIAWPSPGINPDEMARLEAIFPQKSTEGERDKKVAIIQAKQSEKTKDEDEWSDFVSGTSSNRDDDWSDFISSAPAPQKSLQQGPNFSSWTTPQLPPPQFSAWHHSNIFQQQSPFPGVPLVKPPAQPMNNNNNFSGKVNGQLNGFPLVGSPLATISASNQLSNRSRFPKDTSSISVIPDMSFRAPKSLINLPRTGYTKK
ncbi:hypothetical protein DMENIID0001_031530 [Sergentomyia squamirostris]